MMGKLINGSLVYCSENISRINAIRLGFRDIFERDKPIDYSPDTYKTIIEDTVDGIIKYYEK